MGGPIIDPFELMSPNFQLPDSLSLPNMLSAPFQLPVGPMGPHFNQNDAEYPQRESFMKSYASTERCSNDP